LHQDRPGRAALGGPRSGRLRAAPIAALALVLVTLLAPSPARAQSPGGSSAATPSGSAGGRTPIAVLPIRIRSAKPLDHLQRSLPDLLASRLEAGGKVRVIDAALVRDAASGLPDEPSDAAVRKLAKDLGAEWAVVGALTELAGRFSLDVRAVPQNPASPTQPLVYTAESEDELLDRVGELADRIVAVSGGSPRAQVVEVKIEGADVDAASRAKLRTRAGQPYDPAGLREDLAFLRKLPGVGAATAEPEVQTRGVTVLFRLVPAERIFAGAQKGERGGLKVADVQVRGNRRIEADAIRARVSTKAGEPYDPARVASDVREVFALGFFRNVKVLTEDGDAGRTVVFEVEENPVVRQVAISGNENIESDKIRDALTLTSGATLDYPLLFENTSRIEALYRAEGYYLAKVRHDVQTLSPEAVAVNFEVTEGEKLRLQEIRFEGNEKLSDDELTEGFQTKPWRFWSYATSYFDKSGTYAEPVFLQDLRSAEQKYTDRGYLQVELGEPRVDASPDGLVVIVDVKEGEEYKVGKIDVKGDETADLVALREGLALKQGEVFNRSFLTKDVESLTQHYTDRGFYFAAVNPLTNLDESSRSVDVTFDVQRGQLYFIREIEVTGNTTTIDPVVRREMQLVEGQLYSARAINTSKQRVQNLGFFEEVNFEPTPTDQPGQLDLGVKVVEKPTGSLSFGAGFSSTDKFVFSGSLAQSNLFGRGIGVQLAADLSLGRDTNRFYFGFNDPYFLGSEWGFGSTIYATNVEYQDFQEERRGIDVSFGHALNEEKTARGFVGYSFAQRQVDQSEFVNAAAVIFREIFTGQVATSLGSLSFRNEQIDNRLAPTEGYQVGASLEFAGLGGFSKFLRAEARGNWYIPTPKWFPIESTFLLGARGGYALPFNSVTDYDGPDAAPNTFIGTTFFDENIRPLDEIDTDLELPLTERYFLGGLGTFQLRGYRARSVGPRRAVLRRSTILFTGSEFMPVGRQDEGRGSIFLDPNGNPVRFIDAPCRDQNVIVGGVAFNFAQGNGNGQCNDLTDKDRNDFEDLEETDVVGGNKFLSLSAEYRFPISESLGLIGIVFIDAGGAFAEDQNIFDFGEWRYGTGFGALWFSPFGPLQGFLGFPLNPLEIEDKVVFEFSVGGANF
jgi:outer membrane protein insertion porin family